MCRCATDAGCMLGLQPVFPLACLPGLSSLLTSTLREPPACWQMYLQVQRPWFRPDCISLTRDVLLSTCIAPLSPTDRPPKSAAEGTGSYSCSPSFELKHQLGRGQREGPGRRSTSGTAPSILLSFILASTTLGAEFVSRGHGMPDVSAELCKSRSLSRVASFDQALSMKHRIHLPSASHEGQGRAV